MEEVEWILLNLKLKFRIFCATEENFLFIFELEEDIEIFNLRIMYVITISFWNKRYNDVFNLYNQVTCG